ncbi:T9SS type A sorting domain-containing protein [Panacibacter sp. DH6]|uniref:T9SS type A sorting domain-containing protein n=1 Tax=Panacibacter microcysteis TaxID=2793269 RepID=A0A931MC68_9BACT|nr:T9SS type A sorting domain-containing protein [Panacibacter microcysteis]MBG9377917.1 T9SS type A sorting domain-containing protein [Panacibacter microcysteis]
MKKIQLFLLLFLCCSTAAIAQGNYYRELVTKNIRYVNATKDGGYLLTTAAYIIKFDKKDRIEWTRRAADTSRTRFVQAIPVEAGGYIVVTNGGATPLNHTELVRLDSAGAVVWDKRFYNTNETPATFIAEDWAGNFVVTGYYISTAADTIGYLAKFGADGSLLWKRSEFTTGINQTVIRSVEPIRTGRRYMISGSQNGAAYVSAIKDDGSVINATAYVRGSDIFKGNAIKQVSDGLILLPNADNTQTDGLVLKLNNNGAVVWQKRVGGDDKDYLTAVNIFSDTIMLAGKTISFDNATQKTDIYLVKMLTNGTVVWSKTLGTDRDEEAVSITRLKNGGYVIAAKDLDPVNPSCYLMRIDENGNNCNAVTRTSTLTDAVLKKKTGNTFQPGSFFTATPLAGTQSAASLSFNNICVDQPSLMASSAAAMVNIATAATIKVYPNPAVDKINIELTVAKSSSAVIQVINTQSQLVQRLSVNLQAGKNIQTIPVSMLVSGNYVMLVKTDEETKTVKFVKQ